MRCDVLLFAQLREAVGLDRLTIDLPSGATVATALDALAAQHEAIRASRARLAVAVNQSYRSLSAPLHEGDEIALIPPVSGG